MKYIAAIYIAQSFIVHPPPFFNRDIRQRWIKEFRNRGFLSRRGRFLMVCGLLLCPFKYILCFWFFVARVDNMIQIANIACWLKLKYMRIMQLNQNKFQTGQKRESDTPLNVMFLADLRPYLKFPTLFICYKFCKGMCVYCQRV